MSVEVIFYLRQNIFFSSGEQCRQCFILLKLSQKYYYVYKLLNNITITKLNKFQIWIIYTL